MIYDRIYEDVLQAKEIFENKVKNFLPTTDAEKNVLERGRVTANTLNRIEEKQSEIAQILKAWLYLKESILNKEWSDGVFFLEDLERLVKNTITLRKAFYVLSEEQQNPEVRYHFESFNAMEKILAEIEFLIQETKKTFKRSGTVSANQSKLPLKGGI